MRLVMKSIFPGLMLTGLMLAACNSSNKKTAENESSRASGSAEAVDTVFHKTIDGKQVYLFTLQNKSGVKAQITNYGGRLVSLFVPDKNGESTDVVQGFSGVTGYQKSTEPYFGATIGRFGNRIAKGKFTLDGKPYTLFINNSPNTLHGGKKGFQDVVWDAKQLDAQTLQLTYVSKDMEEGFPGKLNVTVTYALTDDNAVKISYKATTDKNTVLNLTNHAFFNLNGEASGTILNHLVEIKADTYTPVDSTLIPTGKIEPVKGTPFDFTSPKTIGERIGAKNEQLKSGNGYDHNFVLNKHSAGDVIARVTGDKSGIVMEVHTDQPGLQFYSGNAMKAKNTMKGGHKDDFQTAFAMETQHFPDSPNQPSFPSTVLKPGQTYATLSTYKFSVKK
jgi:aldose 1-epimerase